MREVDVGFDDKLSKFKRLMRFAAWKYSIPGVLEQVDLYQEALVILNSVFRKYSTKDDSEFRKLFKTELWHGLSNVTRSYKCLKRDYRVSVPLENGGTEDGDQWGDQPACFQTAQVSPETELITKEDYEAAGELVDRVISVLDDDAVDVLGELLDPTPWASIPDVFKTPLIDFGFGTTYSRTPKTVPRHVIADMLGMSLREVRLAKSRIAKEIVIAAESDGRFARLAKARIVAKEKKRCHRKSVSTDQDQKRI